MAGTLEEALRLWQTLGWRVGQHMALINLGLVADRRGDLERAEALVRSSLAVAREIGAPYRLGTSYLLLGWIERRRGKLDVAAQLVGDGLRQVRRIEDPLFTANGLFTTALIAHQRGEDDLAARLLGAAASLYDSSGTRVLEAHRRSTRR